MKKVLKALRHFPAVLWACTFGRLRKGNKLGLDPEAKFSCRICDGEKK